MSSTSASTPISLLRRVGRLSLADAAAAYAAAGLAVFPCVPGTKRPLTRHGFTEASIDLERIAGWWRRWPDANIGVATGRPGGFDVVDVDVHPSGSGFAALRRARDAGLLNGCAAVVRSPAGGAHLYFPTGEGRSQSSWALPRAHVDFRGLGGYVVSPPSQVRVGGRRRLYTLIALGEQSRPLDAPALRAYLAPGRPRPRVRHEWVSASRRGERLAAWLERQPEGNRNCALFWSACRAAESGAPEAEALELLGAAGARIGLGRREIEATVASAFRTSDRRIVESPYRARGARL